MSNQYDVRQNQMQKIIQKRMQIVQEKSQWNYDQQVGKSLQRQPFKYQNVDMSYKVQFTSDIRSMIYDQRTNPQDQIIFTSPDWQLSFVNQKIIKFPQNIPTFQCIRANQLPQNQYTEYFGPFQLQGQIRARSNEPSFKNYHFNLRSNCLLFYSILQKPQKTNKQQFYIWLNQRTYDPLSEHEQYYQIRGQKSIKIRKQDNSRELIERLNIKLTKFAFRGAYGLRYQVPPAKIQDYILGQVNNIHSIDFVHEKKIKQITNTKEYRQITSSFIGLINKTASTRVNQSAEITYPQWLKLEYKFLPKVETILHTNIVPPQNPLMNLKIKINENQVQSLTYTLKYIFPFMKNFVKRSLIVYDSGLIDNELNNMVNQLNYPMHTLAFPKNDLSKVSLYALIEAGGNLYHEVIDMSYNKGLIGIQGTKIISACDSNPSLKKLILKGSYVVEGQQSFFFQALKNSICLSEIQIDYQDHYNQALTQHLMNYDAIMN